jgi:hypothetical protein
VPILNVTIGAVDGAISKTHLEEDLLVFDPYYDVALSANRLPPVYANYMGIDPDDGVYKLLAYNISLGFTISPFAPVGIYGGGEADEITVDDHNGNPFTNDVHYYVIDSITTSNTNYNYEFESGGAYTGIVAAGTISKSSTVAISESISPYTTSTAAWECLMDDFTYETFISDILAYEASDPSYKSLTKLTLTEPFSISEGADVTHNFTVTATPYTFDLDYQDAPYGPAIAGDQVTLVAAPHIGTLMYETDSLVDKVKNLSAAGD